jgi:hypothetical protein
MFFQFVGFQLFCRFVFGDGVEGEGLIVFACFLGLLSKPVALAALAFGVVGIVGFFIRAVCALAVFFVAAGFF